jgi:antitoxin MazE
MHTKRREEFAMRVVRWGKSLAVRLPRDLVETHKLRAGDEIEITVSGARKFEVARDRTIEDALATIRRFRGRMPAGFKFDRNESNSCG